MEFRQPNALSNSIENVLRRNFPRRQSPDNVADVETQTSFENLSNTGALVQRCPLCMQLQPNMNTVNRHSMGEAIQYSNGKGSF